MNYLKIKPVVLKTQLILWSTRFIYSHAVRSMLLKYANITPVFEKGDTAGKSNYRSISTLSNFSIAFEKLIYTQINSFMEPKLSKYLATFCKKA